MSRRAPTAAEINALPESIRWYIHDLVANTDPAGMVLENVMLRDRVGELEAHIALRGSALSAEEWLQEGWRMLRDSQKPEEKAYELGAIEAYQAAGVLSAEQIELWKRRITTCPGHDDEGGRVWCAYCGDLPKAKELEEDEAT